MRRKTKWRRNKSKSKRIGRSKRWIRRIKGGGCGGVRRKEEEE